MECDPQDVGSPIISYTHQEGENKGGKSLGTPVQPNVNFRSTRILDKADLNSDGMESSLIRSA